MRNKIKVRERDCARSKTEREKERKSSEMFDQVSKLHRYIIEIKREKEIVREREIEKFPPKHN